MYKIEIQNTIQLIIAAFNKFTLWSTNDGNIGRIAQKWIHFIYILSFSFSFMGGAYAAEDTDDSIFLSVATILSSVMAVRLYHIIWKKDEILNFLNLFGTHSTHDHEEFIQVNNKLNKFVKILGLFIFTGSIVLGLVAIFPFVSGEEKFLLAIEFPLNFKNSRISFWITQAYLVGGTTYALFAYLITLIIWYLMLNCAIKYEMLGNKLRNLGVHTTDKQTISEIEKQNSFLRELISAIKIHKEINGMIGRFTPCFGNLFFIQVGTSGVCICGTIYNLIFTPNTNFIQSSYYSIALAYCFFDILIIMYLGNEIKLFSDGLSYCLFESNWIEQSQLCKKHMIIMTEYLKQPMELTVGKLYSLNLETFKRILKGAYSMFNVLKSFK